jgi:hypothetical protein
VPGLQRHGRWMPAPAVYSTCPGGSLRTTIVVQEATTIVV